MNAENARSYTDYLRGHNAKSSLDKLRILLKELVRLEGGT